MDVVFVVKPGERNEELRFAFRSLANLPHDQVWIAGHRPRWVSREVKHVAVSQHRSKYENSTANMLAACEHPEVSDQFVYMNDDIFVMQPMEEVPVLHRGSVEQVSGHYATRGSVTYLNGMRETARILREHGYDNLLSYELHAPAVFDKVKMAEIIRMPFRQVTKARPLCFHKRTFYGNWFAVGGEESHDFKIFGRGQAWSEDWPFLSTTDNVFLNEPIGRHIRKQFPEPSPYEKEKV